MSRVAPWLGVLSLVLVSETASAGPWTRDEGRFYVNVAYARIKADSFFAPNFEKIPIRPYTQHSVSLYGEVGVLTRWLTVSLDAQVYRRNLLDGLGLTEGVSDMRVGFWTGLLTSPLRVSFGVLFGLPLGDSLPKPGAGADEAARLTAASLPTGDGEFDVEARASLGYSFGGGVWPLKHYLIAEAGYWLRTSGFADALTYNLELGIGFPWKIVDRFWLSARVFGVESFADQEEAANNATGLGNGVTYTAYGVQLYGRIWKGLGLAVGIDSAFRARAIAAGANLRFTLSFQN